MRAAIDEVPPRPWTAESALFLDALRLCYDELDRLTGFAHLLVHSPNLAEVQDPIEDVIAAIERARLELVELIR